MFLHRVLDLSFWVHEFAALAESDLGNHAFQHENAETGTEIKAFMGINSGHYDYCFRKTHFLKA